MTQRDRIETLEARVLSLQKAARKREEVDGVRQREIMQMRRENNTLQGIAAEQGAVITAILDLLIYQPKKIIRKTG
jgi:hypothetical protein